jgi:hypothetical protein
MSIQTASKVQDFALRDYRSISSAYASEDGGGGNPVGTDLVFSGFGDDNDVFYWLGSSGKTVAWANPYPSKVSISLNPPIVYPGFINGNPGSICDRTLATLPTGSADDSNAFLAIDLGVGRSLALADIAIRQRSDNNDAFLRGFKLEGSNDNSSWADIVVNQAVNTIAGQWSRYSVSSIPGFRYFKLSQTAQNSSQNYVLTIGEIALYGTFQGSP